MIYADNAATTQIDPEAYEIMQEYLKAEYGLSLIHISEPTRPY